MTLTIRIIFGRNVCRLRTGRRLTQEKLAELAEIDPRHLQRIEHGEANPSLEAIVALCVALDAGWEELMRGLGAEALLVLGNGRMAATS